VSRLLLTRSYHFSAGHRLASPALSDAENARVYGACVRQHGHNYRVEVTLQGRVDPVTGMAADIGALDAAVKRLVLDRVDHHDLSATVPALHGVVTTGERLAQAFWEWLAPAVPAGSLARVAVIETDNNAFEYRGETGR
jgi:6-pyruvoyltetrahydropterin/6-carboxytetrahydropterin synthase